MQFQVQRVSIVAVLVLLGAACGDDGGGSGQPDAGIDAGIDAPEAGCGNGVIDPGESCDGAALGDGSCDVIGYNGGAIACNSSCAFEVAGCCNDTCLAENQTMCIGNTLRSCTLGATGCLEWVVTDCAATNDVCDDSDGSAACSCVDRCAQVGDARCEGAAIETCGMRPDGCLDWMESTDCAATGERCAMPPGGAMCVPDETAENCAEAYPLAAGDNVIAWAATTADHLTAQPSCNTTALTGPDLVLSYTAPENGFVRFTMAKPASARQVIVASSAACGTLAPELSCISEFTLTTASDELGVTAGSTYYFYIRDTTSGTAPLDNPLLFNLTETRCSALAVTVSNLSPANGSTVADLTPVLTASLDYPADPSAGVITVTGNLGTSLSYDLATTPDNIAFTDGGKTLVIDPGRAFPPNEMLTVSWTGLRDATCGMPIPAPTWTFQVAGPPCTPGTDGMVGGVITRVATGIPAFTEQYVAADTDPAGYVYVGGLSNLYRTSKTTGSTIDVVLQAPLAAANLGYDMLVDGADVYTLDSNTTATTNQLFRISTDGAMTWSVQNYLQFPAAPNDDLRGLTEYDGRIYLTTDETTAGTQIWSVAAGAVVLPAPAVLEATLATEDNCSGIALDDTYYYLACGGLDRTIRVHRVTHATDLLTDTIPLNTTKNTVHAHDFDADGSADALYVQDFSEEVYYLCEPTGAAPYTVNILASFGTGTSNYGLGFDPATPALWMFDDDTREFVEIR